MTTLAPSQADITAGELRAALGRHGYRQTDLARFLGVSRASASEIYNGAVPLSLDRLAVIAEWLGVSRASLLGEDADKVTTRWALRGSNPQPTDYGLIGRSGYPRYYIGDILEVDAA